MGRTIFALSVGAFGLLVPWPAQATYSTVAMERSTGRYGAVSASCVRLSTLQRVYAAIPDHGAVLTQSHLVDGDASQALALQLLWQRAGAADVVAAMTDPGFDAAVSLRQYVVVDAYGDVVGFTGPGAGSFAGHLDASDAAFSVGVAGNFLTGASVLEAAALGFQDPTACDLEERLVNALVAASASGLGDARCVVEGRPAKSTWLSVAGSNGAADLDITVEATPDVDPIPEVLSHFSEWRSSHPCPVEPEVPNPAPGSEASQDRSDGCSMARPGGSSLTSSVWLPVFLLVFLSRRRAHTATARARPE